MTKSVQLIEPGDEQRFSDGYMVAMEQIEFELRTRHPEYRDRNHYSWPSEYAQRRRLNWITNAIVCSLLRAPAILAHHILGGAHPECPDEYSHVDSIVNMLFGLSPSYYIASKMKIRFAEESLSTLIGLAELGDVLSSDQKGSMMING